MQHTTLPIVLLPGLNGDPRIFTSQCAAFRNAIVVEWIDPIFAEGIEEYAGRLAGTIDLVGPCITVGVSFGGLVARELARRVPAKCCVVISSALGPIGLPSSLRLLRLASQVIPPSFTRCAIGTGWSLAASCVPPASRRARGLSDRGSNCGQ